MTKKNALLVSLTGLVVFLVAMYPVDFGICEKPSYDCRNVSNLVQMLFGIFPFIFLSSLITYKMRDEVFRAWWSFARWFVPVLIAVTFLLENAGSGGGYLGMQKDFNFLVLFIFYAIFIITSLVKIILAYRRSNRTI